MKQLIFILFFFSIISCNSDSQNKNSDKDKIDTSSFQQKIKINDPQFALEADAKRFASNWVEFITAQNEIRKLENSSLEQVMGNSETIAQIMESLKTSLPDSLSSVPVEARLNVITTKAQLLNQYSNKQHPSADDIKRTTRELNLEFNNLKLQMNELFLKTLEDFEKELDEFEDMEREMDSLNNSEKTEKALP